MRILYSAAILLYTGGIYLASVFNTKARLLVSGRKGWYKKLRARLSGTDKIIWFHCASLGEFEQGRPVMELVKEKYPDYRILLTFFSPSGYEIRKNWPLADHILYLPADTRVNAVKFLKTVRPSKVFFVKYEFWNNFISEIHRNKIPLFLISGIFRPKQHFFRWYGGFFIKILGKFTHIFVQDDQSAGLLKSIGISQMSLAGDTRFDRVKMIADSAADLPLIEAFCRDERVVIAGSSWHQDEEIYIQYINEYPQKTKWIIAPHEVSRSNIERIESALKVRSTRYSQESAAKSDARVLIIDNIGILSSAYRYATVAVIGGGFGKGIHNILEAACWGLPVLFGPNHTRFMEANRMLALEAAFCFRDYTEFGSTLNTLLDDSGVYDKASARAADYVLSGTGATGKIVDLAFKT